MELKITQLPANGFFGGPHSTNFTTQVKNANFNVAIEQLGERRITISSAEEGIYNSILDVYYTLETILMLCDGHFYPVVSAFDNGVEITQSWKKRTLPSYQSADFMSGTGNTILNYETVLDAQLFEKWNVLKDELDLIHKMVLYCLSDVKMPKDMQCAFMSESFIGIAELVHEKHTDFVLPKVPPKQSKLKYFFLAIVARYGKDIFAIESASDIDKFAQILVNSRNRIAHIKSKQDRTYLNGGESVMYLVKLSLLYRVILFDLLGIPESLFHSKLVARIQEVNDHPVMKGFLAKLSQF